MVGFKPSDNAKIVGSLSGIHKVFNALRDATADHVSARRKARDLEKIVEEAKVSVKENSWVENVIKRMKENALLLKAIREGELWVDQMRVRQQRYLDTSLIFNNAEIEVTDLQCLASIDLSACEDMRDRLRILKGLKDRIGTAREVQEKGLRACEALQGARSVDLSVLEGDRARLTQLRALSIRRTVARKAVDEGTDVRQKLGVAAGMDLGSLEGDRSRLNELRALSGNLELYVKAYKLEADPMRGLQDNIYRTELDYSNAVDAMEICPVTGKAMPEDCKKSLTDELYKEED